MQSIDSIKSYLDKIHDAMDKFSKETFGKPRTSFIKFQSFNGNNKGKTSDADQHYFTLSRNVTQCQKLINEFNSYNPKGNQTLQKKLPQQLNKCLTQIQKIRQFGKFSRSQVKETELESHLEFLLKNFGQIRSNFDIFKDINLEKKLLCERKNSLQKTVLSPVHPMRFQSNHISRESSASTIRNSSQKLNETNKPLKRVNNLIQEQAQGEDSRKSSDESASKEQKKTKKKQEKQQDNKPKQAERNLQKDNKLLKQQNLKLKKQLEQLRNQQQKQKEFEEQLKEGYQSKIDHFQLKIEVLEEKVSEAQEQRKQVEKLCQHLEKRLEQMEAERQGKVSSGVEESQGEDADLTKMREELASIKKDLDLKCRACQKLSNENASLKAVVQHYETSFSQFCQQFNKKPLK